MLKIVTTPQQTEDTVTVTVNAPEYVDKEETFDATIDVVNITDLNSAQFDLSFDSSVVNVTDVADGSLNGTAIPVSMWDFVDADTVKVLVSVPIGQGVIGSGNLAKIRFEVVGEPGGRSELNISKGLLVNKEAEEIPAEWIDDEITIGQISAEVKVNAPELVKAGETFDVTIDVVNLTDFNSAQFDLSFDPSVVDVTGVADGSLDGARIPVSMWNPVGADTVRVLVSMPIGQGVSGSGYIAKVSCEVVGKAGDGSELDISGGLLVNKEAAEILALWIDDEVVIGAEVKVNAPELVKAGETFDATIDVVNITDLNSAQFDLSFDSSVVNVTDVADGSLNGTAIPVSMWDFVDADTVKVLVSVPIGQGVIGSGNLAKIRFEVVGEPGGRSELNISKGLLVNKEAEEIPAEWIDDEITIGQISAEVKVNAPELVKAGETFDVTIDVVNLTDFNSAEFDLSFNSSVVNVTGVADGNLNGARIPVSMWDSFDADTVRVLVGMPMGQGGSGSGYLAKVSFDVVGNAGDGSDLDISNGLLVNKEAVEILALWIDDEVVIGDSGD